MNKCEYLKIAGNLKAASNKKMDPEEKIRLLRETKKLEADAIEDGQDDVLCGEDALSYLPCSLADAGQACREDGCKQ